MRKMNLTKFLAISLSAAMLFATGCGKEVSPNPSEVQSQSQNVSQSQSQDSSQEQSQSGSQNSSQEQSQSGSQNSSQSQSQSGSQASSQQQGASQSPTNGQAQPTQGEAQSQQPTQGSTQGQQSTQAPTESQTFTQQKAEVVTFGRYEQDGNESNGKEPIEWYVLEREGGKALLISKYVLDEEPYRKEDINGYVYGEWQWNNSTLKSWLNETFYNVAFVSSERAGLNSIGGDKVTILDFNQYKKYYEKCFEVEPQYVDGALNCYNIFSLTSEYCYDSRREPLPATIWLKNYGLSPWLKDLNEQYYLDFWGIMGVRPVIMVDTAVLNMSHKVDQPVDTGNYGPTSISSSVEPGSIVKFGSYEQDGNLLNGKEDIEWIVLKKEDGKVFLTSKYVLDEAKEPDVQKWLEETFYNTAFNSTQKNKIVLSDYLISESQLEGGTPVYRKNITAKVSMLTQNDLEYEDEIHISQLNKNQYLLNSNGNFLCKCTEYAKSQGVASYNGYAMWRLREVSHSYYMSYGISAHTVTLRGLVRDYVYGDYYREPIAEHGVGVRPAMWVTLD